MKFAIGRFILCLAVLLPFSAIAKEPANVMPITSAVVTGLDNAIAQAKKNANVSVYFPTVMPRVGRNKHFFANSDTSQVKYGINYRINIDGSPNCHGIHYCNIAYVMAKQGTKYDTYYDRNGKPITVPVTLTNNIQGYYTPGHPMADYFPASMQWIDKGVHYTISWDAIENSLIAVTNSAIVAGPR